MGFREALREGWRLALRHRWLSMSVALLPVLAMYAPGRDPFQEALDIDRHFYELTTSQRCAIWMKLWAWDQSALLQPLRHLLWSSCLGVPLWLPWILLSLGLPRGRAWWRTVHPWGQGWPLAACAVYAAMRLITGLDWGGILRHARRDVGRFAPLYRRLVMIAHSYLAYSFTVCITNALIGWPMLLGLRHLTLELLKSAPSPAPGA